MEYSSAKETAIKWGISKARVITLAKEGRIKGAAMVGSTWMIPKDAPRPSDNRYKTANKKSEQTEFHFPLFMYGPIERSDFLDSLTDEEMELFAAEKALEQCQFESSFLKLKEILNKTDNIYIKIGACYYLCQASVALVRPVAFNTYIGKLHEIFEGDFQYKEDLKNIFVDLDSLYLGTRIFLENFNLKATYKYTLVAQPYLYCLSTLYEILKAVSANQFIMPYSGYLTCEYFETRGYSYTALRLHIYLAVSSAPTDQGAAIFHLKQAFRLAIENNFYLILASFYPYMKLEFNKVLEDFDPAIGEEIKSEAKGLQKNIVSFLGKGATSAKEILSLTEQQIQLMDFAIMGYTNKEISQIISVPEYTIRRRYEKLFDQFNAANKKQLAKIYISILTDSYNQ